VPKFLRDGLLAQERVKEATALAAAFDWAGAAATLAVARALGATADDGPKRLSDGVTVHDRVPKAVAAAKAGDWTEAKRLLGEARAAGATDADVPANLRDGVAAYDAKPVAEILEPVDGAVVTTPTIRVRVRAVTPRAGDLLFVRGADRMVMRWGMAPAPEGEREWIVVLPEAKAGAPWSGEVVAQVKNGDEVRAESRKRVTFRPSTWTKFLDGWAVPDGEEIDKSTKFPKQIRRLVDDAPMALVNAGSFKMGSRESGGFADATPVHTVTLSKAFYLDLFEITIERFGRHMMLAPSDRVPRRTLAETLGKGGWLNAQGTDWGDLAGLDWTHPRPESVEPSPSEPVSQVTWDEATAYATWSGAALPTEAQFEYALGGGAAGNAKITLSQCNLGDSALTDKNVGFFALNDWRDGYPFAAPVGQVPARVGPFADLCGNVWEWCADWYASDYFARSPSTDPKGPPKGTQRVARGGAWTSGAIFRLSQRQPLDPATRHPNVGFRCAKTLP
jgi:formylglycine-generating enzyme required for sulfatase activity